MERVTGIVPAAAWPTAEKGRFSGRAIDTAKDTVHFGSGIVGTPPKSEKPRSGWLKTLVFLAIGAAGGYLYGASGQECVQETPVMERQTSAPPPVIAEEREQPQRQVSSAPKVPKNLDSTAIYNELNRQSPDLATIATHLEQGGDLTDRFGGRPLFVTGMLRAASLGDNTLADFMLERATPELLGYRTVNHMNVLHLMASRSSDDSVTIFEKTLNAMKAAGVENIAAKDTFDWHLAHRLAFFGNHGALQVVINDTETFGDPKTYLSASTKPYDNGQEGRTHQVTPGRTPAEIAQRELESTVEGSNIAVSQKKQSLCEGADIPAESQAECAELNASLAGAAERIQEKRARLEDTLRLIQETLA